MKEMKGIALKSLGIALCGALSLFSLKCGDKAAENSGDAFNRRAMLENYADNVIIPSFAELQGKTNALNDAVAEFAQFPTESRLLAARNAWEEAYLAWQFCNGFNFGPAQTSTGTLFQKAGVFPANASRIEEFIAARNFDNDLARDARGFNAIEYLLYDTVATSQVVAKFNNPDRRQYLRTLAAELKANIDAVVAGWQTYRNEFVSRNGTDVGSSTSILFNEFVMSFESVKNFKLGVPLGRRPGQTAPEPKRVEAFYSGKSIRFMREHLKAIEQFYYGIGRNGADGIGFVEYLQSVPNGRQLVAQTEAQLAVVKNRLNALPPDERLSQLIVSNFALVDALHSELQRHTRFFKSEMASLLSLTITFSSGDGD
ncbi:MAG: imelysin family protein [Chloroherpetonaceae bacterium]|nr:imelysin family protein [Chloroherpetonaceae bacterium]MDW8438677.1 imelysin family protein [Chloroherpetonaceae bacterium]